MPKQASKEEREHMARVAALGCIVMIETPTLPWKVRCGSPAAVHHVRPNGRARKLCHFDTLPLCPFHHQGHGLGNSLHDGVKTWEAKFGTQAELLKQTRALLDD